MPVEKKLSLYSEDVALEKSVSETGRLKVAKRTLTREAVVDSELLQEEAIVETIPKGHQVLEMPVTRTEGDTTIIPIIEEVIHVDKRLILKEEIRITRRKTAKRFHDTVTLRHQEAVVSRVESDSSRPRVQSESESPSPRSLGPQRRRKRTEKPHE